MKNHFWTPAKRHTSRGYPGQQHMTKKTHQILRERGWEEGLKFPVFEQRNKKGFESPDKCVDLLFELIQILYRNSFTESAEETL